MNRTICIKYAKRLALGLAVLALAATPSFAQTTYDLCASDGTVTIGSTAIPIWGYADITGGGTCTTGMATLPGPKLRATADGTLTINLSNALSVPVSFFAPGLRADIPNDGTGLFTSEVAAGGVPVMYTFSSIKAGTYLYHSGTDITTQVPMGLYGALVIDVAPGQAYSDVAYAQDEVLVYSEIDPNLNANPAGFGGARVINWAPQYFLINGEAYPGAISVGTSQSTLLRFVNAGLQTFVPTFDGGLYMDLKAEDGNRYPQPFKQYGIELPAGKTIDAIVNPGTEGPYKLYDRALHAGLLISLEAVAVIGAPTAVDDPATPGAYTIAEGGSLATTAGGSPAGVLDNDTSTPPVSAILVTDAANGTLALAGDGSFTYAPDAYFNGTDTFTYMANNGTLDSNVATVTITVTPVNDGPTAVADLYDALEGEILTVAAPGVLGNDSDPDGDALQVTVVGGTDALYVIMNSDGGFSFDATSFVAPDVRTFDYDACDPSMVCSTATVTITIVAVVNLPPVANDDAAMTPLNTAVAVDVVANDTDADGNLDPTTVTITSAPISGGTAVDAITGAITYTPATNIDGAVTFDYQVCDTGGLCDIATVTITVVNATPFAANDFADVARNSGAADPANTFSVTANDIDTDDGIDVTSVVITSGTTASRGGTVINIGDGTVTFIPKRGFRGTDTFTYTVQDNLGAVSNVATVRVNVR